MVDEIDPVVASVVAGSDMLMMMKMVNIVIELRIIYPGFFASYIA